MKKRIRLLSVVLVLVTLSLFSSDLWSASVRGLRQLTSGAPKVDAAKGQSNNTVPEKRASQQGMKKGRSLSVAQQDVHSGKVMVKFTEEASVRIAAKTGKSGMIKTRSASSRLRVGLPTVDERLEPMKATQMKRVFPYHPRYEARQRAAGLHLWYEIDIDSTATLANICRELELDGNVQIAEPILKKEFKDINGKKQKGEAKTQLNQVVVMPLSEGGEMSALSTRASRTPLAPSTRSYEDTPPVNDPMLLQQWHYYNYGQVKNPAGIGSIPGADIKLFDAWKITMGDPRVIVSVHDQGVQFDHPDLAANMWINQAEKGGRSGVDDDNNGYIDDIFGYNFASSTSQISPGEHGSHVAGTISAVNNNGVGVAGIAGGSGKGDGVRIMGCQVFMGDASAGFAQSYVYAANNGAVISQNSWGHTKVDFYEQAVLDAIDYFIEYAGKDENGNPLPNTPMVGGIVIFASGNEGTDGKSYPGYYEPCLAVSATGPWNNKPKYSNYGSWVDISAPGGSLEDDGTEAAGVLSTVDGGKYSYFQGTSMACPHVSGVAALVLSAYGHEAYTPAMLRNRLIAGVTKWSEIGKDEYAATMGVGLLNAAKAVAPDNAIAPETITDLKVESIGYEFMRVTFKAPKDKDNGGATSYELRYSADSMSATCFSKGIALFQTAKAPGQMEEIIIDRLKGFTKYYIAVKGVDIWGNTADISNIVEATTLDAPAITTAPDSMAITVDHAATVSGEGMIRIGNTQGGDLRYAINYAIQKEPNSQSEKFTNFIYNYDPYAADMKRISFGSNGEERFLSASRFVVKDKKGFSLTTVSAAITAAYVDPKTNKPIGWVSTPFQMKVYKGGNTPAEGKLLYNAKYSISFKDFYLLGEGADLGYKLSTTLRFDEGESFWVVFDFEKGFYNPMVVNDNNNSLSGGQLYSVNDTTWADINTVAIKDARPKLSYRVFALSTQNRLPEDLIAFEPVEGFVKAGETKSVKVKVNAQKVEEGDYTSVLFISHNDPKKPIVQIPLRFTVDGHNSGIRSEKVLSLGNVVQGFSETRELTLYNDSLGILEISSIVSDRKQFTVKPNKDIKILPGDTTVIEVTFNAPKPGGVTPADSAGMFLAKLNFTTNRAEGVYSVMLDGVSIERPIATLPEKSKDIELRMGERKEVSFVLKNEGKYRLDYRVEQDKTTDFDFEDTKPNVKQYYGKRTFENWSRLPSPNPRNKVQDITKQVKGLRNAVIPLPFTVNYYGVDYDTITVAGNGNIHMGRRPDFLDNASRIGGWAIPATIFPCARTNVAAVTMQGGLAYLLVEGDKVTIEYTKFGEIEGGVECENIRIQTVIYADGRVELKYTGFAPKPRGEGNLAGMIGMSDNTTSGGIGVWLNHYDKKNPKYYISGSTYLYGAEESTIVWQGEKRDTIYYKWTPPVIEYRKNTVIRLTPEVIFAKDITPESGHLMPGEEVTINVKVGTDKNLKEGKYIRTIPIFTNDPENKEVPFKLNIDFKSDAKPTLGQTELNFGKVGKQVTVTKSVLLRNLGGKAFKATGRMSDGTFFSVTPSVETDCGGLSAMEYDISFTPIEEKAYTDRLIIDIKDGDPLTLDVKGEGTKAPRLEVVKSADKFAFEVDLRKAGAHYVDTTLTVKNIGEAPLNYNLMSTEWIKDMTPALMSGMDKSGYYWSDNQSDASGVNYEWIEENPIPYNPLGRIDGLLYMSKEFELPWEFEYYGEKFTKCYTDMSGMISFHRDDILYHPMMTNAIEAANLTIPHAGMCNGFIAGIGGSFDNSKHWYEVVGEGDDAKIVFTWKNRPLFDAMTAQDTNTVTFQTILYKDGSIKFQYKDVERAWWRNRTVIGIENRQGTDGLNICSNEAKYIKNGLAIFIKPSRMKTLKPGEEKTYRLRADATNMWELNDANGKTLTHTGQILINSNDPSNPQNLTAVSMKVLGESKTELFVDGEALTDTLAYGKVYKSHYPNAHRIDVKTDSSLRYIQNSLKYIQKVTVKNTGNKTMKIHSEKRLTFLNQAPILNDQFEYTQNFPSMALYVEIPPKQSYTLALTLNPTNRNLGNPAQSAPDSGFHVYHYPLAERCEAGDSATCRKLGYPNHIFVEGWMGTQYAYSYKTTTIPVSFDIYDVPQEKIVSEKSIQEIIFDARQGSENFAFEMKNEAIEDKEFWNTMHQLQGTGQEKTPIVKQSDLDYELEIENLTKKEFNDLRSKKEAKVETSFVTAVKTGVAPVLTEQMTSLPFAAATATARPMTRSEAGSFLDSLGYFNHDGRMGGFTSGKQGVSVVYYIRYKAGAEGFNLTHFTAGFAKFKNAPEDGYEVKIKVLQGRDARTADVIHAEAFTPELVNFSEFAMVEHRLEKNVYIYPNEYFWVSLETTFNTSIDMWGWKGAINYMHGLEQNFMIDFMGSFDLAVTMTGQYVAPSVTIYSDDQAKEVKNWIEVSKNNGSVKLGASDKITVTVNPENDRTEMITRYARVRVKSNDTYPWGVDSTLRCGWYFKNSVGGGKDSVNFDTYVRDRNEVLVMMRMNQAPEFTMENQTITLSEMQDSTVIVYVKDIENDKFDDLQVVLDSSVFRQPAYGISPVTELKKADAKGDTTCFAFTVKPGYESEGTHVYSFTTKDAKGNSAKCSITVIVSNKNRTPEMVGANAIILQKEIYKNVNLNTLFVDADRQSLTYLVEALTPDVVTGNIIDSTLTLFGWQVGEAEMKVTGTDPEGAFKTVTFKLTVIDEDPSKKSVEVHIYPNPVVEIMNCGFSLNKRSDVQFRIFNTDGRMFYESKKLSCTPGKHEEKINVSNLPGGMFILQYIVDGVVKDTQKFIK